MHNENRIIILHLATLVLASSLSNPSFIFPQSNTNKAENYWLFDASSGIPVWIARKEKFGGGWRLLVYLEPQNYSLDNLKKIYSSFSAQYKDSKYIDIDVSTSKNIIEDKITARKIGLLSVEELPDEKRSKRYQDLSVNGKCFRSNYFRSESKEWLTYDTSEETGIKIILRETEAKFSLEKLAVSNFKKAISEENLSEIQKLLDKGISVNLQSNSDWTPLMYAIQKNSSTDVSEFLISKGANVNLKTKPNKLTPLMWASINGEFDFVKMLVNFGADVNLTDKDGDTALIFASRVGNFEIVSYLIEVGAKTNIKNKRGETAFNVAKEKEIVELLLNNRKP